MGKMKWRNIFKACNCTDGVADWHNAWNILFTERTTTHVQEYLDMMIMRDESCVM